MDNEELKDIIVDDCEVVAPLSPDTLDGGVGEIIAEVPEAIVMPEAELVSKEQLEGNEPLTLEKKTLAAAIAAARELGIIEDEEPYSPATLAETADKIIEDLRLEYQAGTGEISPEEAYEDGLDRKAARFTANMHRVVDQLVERVGTTASVSIRIWADKAFDWVEEQWPETRAFRPAAEKVVEVLDHKVVPAIVVGAQKIADKVKVAITAGVEKVKTAAKKVTDFVKGLFS